MKSQSKIFKIAILGVFIAFILSAPVFAEDLLYMGENDPSQMQTQNTQPGYSNVMPVNYSTNYSTQFSPYASFMNSPYTQGNLSAQYQFMGQPQYTPPPPGQQTANQDPFMASEVSPYSKYSPYIEVIGEGSDYTLGIDDVVTVIVRNQPDFSGRFVIDPEGNIQYNFVGDIKAEGKTKEELKADVVSALKKFVRYPEVAVMISEYRSKAVYIFGYVNRPGKFAMKGDNITVKEAVVAAGLPTYDGALKRVYVIRPSQYTESGEAEKKKVNLKELLYKGDSANDFMLMPGDTIVVHQRYFDKFVNNFSRLVGPLFQASAVYELAYGGQDGYLKGD
ncbi:MAG: polysaccharide biosynthesis/export family protein [Candidatus Omnitrophica bacterium]|nr:polysaccharide biosynthesis/export family protein [Candidatus Omnitrophota bacterium]